MGIFAYIAVQLVAALVLYALQKPPRGPSPAQLGDVQVPTFADGTPVPVVFGDVNVHSVHWLWYGAWRPVAIVKGGKK